MKKIFLEKLPRNKDKFNWKGSIGCKVPFIYDDIKGEIEIIDYLCCKSKLKIKYNNKSTEMTIGNFQRVNLGRLIGKIVKGFKFEINQNIKDNKRDLTIIDKEYRKKLIKKSFENQKYYKYHCNKCGNEDWIREGNLINSRGCPVCSKHKAKLGINTIWDTDRWMCNLGVSEEDAKKYSRGSSRKITVKCPNCGREKKIVINSIYLYQSIGCSCGDGKSYPEKFVMNFLEQLNVSFEVEYSPDWIDNKRYDFHIEDINCIIETHGKQHYSIKTNFKSCGGRNFNQEQQNDKIKRETALKNGIKHYIELDCSESNMNYIKNSILNSEISKLFDLSNIDWLKCSEFACKNRIKEACEYWNNGTKSTIKIGKIMKLTSTTIKEYLKQGKINNWCDYNPDMQKKKVLLENHNKVKKKIICLENNRIFNSIKEASNFYKIDASSISSVCKGRRKTAGGFSFKYV